MPRIEPIPLDELAEEPRQIIEEGVADGTYATPIPLQIFAYRTQQILMTNAARGAWGTAEPAGGPDPRAHPDPERQLGECQPCMQSRKHDSITDEDVACLVAPGRFGPDRTGTAGRAVPRPPLGRPPRHRRRGLPRAGQVFTAAQIIELGFTCANAMGLHRFIHTLDVFGTSEPVIAYDPDQVDTAIRRCPGAGAGMSETVFVTGATGLAGANICKLLIERGDTVRALARAAADTGPLVALGVEVVTGDVTDADDVRRAATGGRLGHPLCRTSRWGQPESGRLRSREHRTARSTCSMRPKPLGMRRVVAVSTGTFFDTAGGLDREDAPVSKEPSSDPYTITKMAAFQDAMARAAAGQDVVTHPPGRHLRPFAGGEQRARAGRASTGCCCRLCASASSAT